MNNQILNYIRTNSAKFSAIQLKASLLRAGYKEVEIDEAINFLLYPQKTENIKKYTKANKIINNQKLIVFTWKFFFLLGSLSLLASAVFIVISLLPKESNEIEVVSTYSENSSATNSISFEDLIIEDGSYEVNKKVPYSTYSGDYSMTLNKIEVKDFQLKLHLTFSFKAKNKYSSGWLSSPCSSELTNEKGEKIKVSYDSDYVCSSESLKNSYDAFEKSSTVEGWIVFEHPSSGAKSLNFTYGSFPTIKDIILK